MTKIVNNNKLSKRDPLDDFKNLKHFEKISHVDPLDEFRKF